MNSLLKALPIFVLWIAVDFITPFAFAAEIEGTVEQVIQVEAKKLENPKPTLPPEIKCGNCLEDQQIKTEVKPSQIPSPSPSGADVRGAQATPEPTLRKITKPVVKLVTSPSSLPSPSASISASPSPEPISEPVEKKQNSPVEYIWNWILKLFR